MAQISNRVRQQYADAVQLLKEHGVVNTPEWQRVSQVLEKFPVLAVKPAMILLAKRPWIVQRLVGIPTDYSCKEYRFELIGAEELGCLVEALMTKRPTLEQQALLGARARAVDDAASEEVRLKAYFAHLTASVWSSPVQAATRSGFDSFYQVSQTMVDCPQGLWQAGMMVKLAEHLKAAKQGDRDRESRLVNRLGQLRRCVESSYISPGLQEQIVAAVGWLRDHGRTVDFSSADPAKWISQRGGAPRW